MKLPDDLDVLRVPERALLAFLRVALTLSEQALLGKHRLLRHARFPSATEARTTALTRSSLVRGAQLHAVADVDERLLVGVGPQHKDDDYDDLPF